MAKQTGSLKLEGTIGNLTFYKSGDRYFARQAAALSAERIANDKAFERTRENAVEFGRASKAATLIRAALKSQLQRVPYASMHARLVARMIKVLKADTTNMRGMRNVTDGNVALLQGFDFNNNSELASTLYVAVEAAINRVTGQFITTLPCFIPANVISSSIGATHYRIHAAAAEIDFTSGKYMVDNKETALLPLNEMPTGPISLESNLTPASRLPLFLAAGIEFLQLVNNEHFQLQNGAYNSLSLVKVEKG